jgi:hypothetical protein
MIKTKWADIAYSATFNLDYHFIAIPQDFNDGSQNKKWLEKYINATTSVPEGLREKPRWSLFRDEDYCVVGVTSMLKYLVEFPNTGVPLLTETQDFKKREVYGFWGYVTKVDQRVKINIPQMKLQLFQRLHTYVKNQWLAPKFLTN